MIGCEYASILRALDVKVNLVNTRDQLLEFLDDEITDALGYHLREQGVLIRTTRPTSVSRPATTASCCTASQGKKFKTDILLWANGAPATPTTWGSRPSGCTPNQRGQLEVNESYQTVLPHIYAVGRCDRFTRRWPAPPTIKGVSSAATSPMAPATGR